jgi:hypothetical protein
VLRGHGQRVRATSGNAADRELAEPERVGDGDDVSRRLHDRPSGQPSRPAVSGPVIGDDPSPDPFVAFIAMAHKAAPGGSVKPEDRRAVGRPPQTVGQRTTVSGHHRAGLSHPHSLSAGYSRRKVPEPGSIATSECLKGLRGSPAVRPGAGLDADDLDPPVAFQLGHGAVEVDVTRSG